MIRPSGWPAAATSFIVRLYTGRFGPFPAVEEAAAYAFSPPELAIVEQARARTVAGTPDRVKARLEALTSDYGVDEVVVVTIAHEFKARLRSYELLAEVFGLV
jgi:alkanesulfonate monooxygenase SsuD/methylene tetrahydromethanopterin reductase-like flavin-dependent oxidoreductase (luciferase family)